VDKLRKAKPSNVGIVAVDGAGLIKFDVAPPSINRLAVTQSRRLPRQCLAG
jgi:hypothetical protein